MERVRCRDRIDASWSRRTAVEGVRGTKKKSPATPSFRVAPSRFARKCADSNDTSAPLRRPSETFANIASGMSATPSRCTRRERTMDLRGSERTPPTVFDRAPRTCRTSCCEHTAAPLSTDRGVHAHQTVTCRNAPGMAQKQIRPHMAAGSGCLRFPRGAGTPDADQWSSSSSSSA